MAVGVTGCVVIEEKGNVIRYQKKCDACGYLVPGIMMTSSGAKGCKMTTVFRCTKCGKDVNVLIQY